MFVISHRMNTKMRFREIGVVTFTATKQQYFNIYATAIITK